MRTHSHRRYYRLAIILLLLCTSLGALPSGARAAGATISALYPATMAAYSAWNANSSSTTPPPKTTTFPSGVKTVAFYFEYQGATANTTQYKYVITNAAGATFLAHGPYTFAHDAGLHMSPIDAPGGPYPNGAYHVNLLVDGHVAASTSFTVGAASSIGIITYYTATKQAYDAWNATTSTADPPRTTVFPAGTTKVAFYFHYRGAKAKVSQFRLVIHGPSGAVYLTDGPYTLTYANGYEMDAIPALSHGAYPSGAYSVDLVIDGQTVGTTSYTVRSVSSAAITTLYPATKAAYDAWNASTSTARPARTMTFNAGTTIVAFYFEYKNAVAKSTQYQFVVHSASGAIFGTYGPYTTLYTAALAMRYAAAPHNGAYPNGRYHVDMVIDGHVVAGTDFTVGSQGVTITAYYPATKAAYDAWNATTSTAAPGQTTTFKPGTTIVAFYFAYKGAVAKKTQYKYIVYDRTGKVFTTHGPYAFPYRDGYQMSPVVAPSGSYASGAYRADLLVDGQVTQSTYFTVGAAPAPKACTASDYIATCVEPSILRLHAGGLANNMMAEGTGFVIQSDATGTYLLTNKHVVDGATAANMKAISPDGHTQYQVQAIQENNAEAGSAGDLAVVKLQPTALQPLKWGNSDSLKLLQQVVSIGYGDAFDLPGPPTVTQGVISALHRDLGDGYGGVWIQHQSFINHGNSGGPLLDMNFNVVGVNTLSQKQTQGIFFAIPTTIARQAALRLIAKIQGQ